MIFKNTIILINDNFREYKVKKFSVLFKIRSEKTVYVRSRIIFCVIYAYRNVITRCKLLIGCIYFEVI